MEQNLTEPIRKREPQRAAQKREQQALRQHLPYQPEAPRPDRCPNREFTRPHRTASQEHSGHVRTNDEQHNRYHAQQDKERCSKWVHVFVGEISAQSWRDLQMCKAAFLHFLVAGNVQEVLKLRVGQPLRLRKRDTRLHARHGVHPTIRRAADLPDLREFPAIRQISGAPDRWMNTVARMKPGVTLSQAQGLADAQFQDFLHVTGNKEVKEGGFAHLQVTPGLGGYFTDEYVHPFRAPLFVLLGMVAIVLLIVCSNVAGMLLARGAVRTREFAIRTSIGAGRFRLIRQMLAESLLLSLLGGALGLALSYWLSQVLFHFLPQGHINIELDLRPDARVAEFTFAISLLTGLLFGLAPALEATRGNLTNALKSDIVSSTARFRKVLVVFQVAFSLVLLIAAGVFVRTLADLRPIEFRGNPDHLLLFTMKPQQEIYTEARKQALVEELSRRMSALAGVQSVAFAENGALGSRTDRTMVEVRGESPIRAGYDSVTPGFFDTAGIQKIDGRDFDGRDSLGSPLVAVVNQALARGLFRNQNPLGRSLSVVADGKKKTFEIVGVVADTHYYDVHKGPGPFVWFAMAQVPPYMPTLHVRTSARDTAGVVAAVRREFDAVDKGFPVFNIRTMEARIDDSLASERMVANLA